MDRNNIEKSEYNSSAKVLTIFFKDKTVKKYIGSCTVWVHEDSFIRCCSNTEEMLWEQWYKCKYMDYAEK